MHQRFLQQFTILCILIGSMLQPAMAAPSDPPSKAEAKPWYESFWKAITFQSSDEAQKPPTASLLPPAESSPAQKLFDAIDYLQTRFLLDGSVWSALKSSNTLLEAVAADSTHNNDEKMAFLEALRRMGTPEEKTGDKEFVHHYLDELLAGSSNAAISKFAWFIIKEKSLIASLPGASNILKQAPPQAPIDPFYLADLSQQYLKNAKLEDWKKDWIQKALERRQKDSLRDMVNAKDDKSRGNAALDDTAGKILENAKNKKSSIESIVDCVDAYMESGKSGQNPFGGSTGGGVVDPVGTTIDPNKGGQGGVKTPGQPMQNQNPMFQAGQSNSSSKDSCYGVDMTQLNDYISAGKDNNRMKAYILHDYGTVRNVYSVRQEVKPTPDGKSNVYTIHYETFEVQPDPENPDQHTLVPETSTTTVVIGDEDGKKAFNAAVTKAKNDAHMNYFGGAGEDTSGLGITTYTTTGKDANHPITPKQVDKGCGKDCGIEGPPESAKGGKKKVGNPDAVEADSPCDGEKDHMAFAECIGSPGGSPGGDTMSCSEYRDCMANGGGNCAGGKSAQGAGPSHPCQGDSAAIELYAMHPNLPLWDPLHFEAIRQNATPQMQPALRNPAGSIPLNTMQSAPTPANKSGPSTATQKPQGLMQYLKGLMQKPDVGK